MSKISNIARILYTCMVLYAISIGSVYAEHVELMDFSGTQYNLVRPILWLKDTPSPISDMEILIEFDPDIIKNSTIGPNSGFLSDNATMIGVVSGSYGQGDGYFSLDFHFSPPIPVGASCALTDIPFSIQGTQSTTLRISTGGDVAELSAKDAMFTYIPTVENDEGPVLHMGTDQVVFTNLVLSAQGSYDFVGMIVSWEWRLIHRTRFAYSRTSLGKNVTITDLVQGVYDVALTLTDNVGLQTIGLITVSAAGSGADISGDISGNGTIGLEDVMQILQTLSGTR